jgi:Cu(I)/Ag(I) efflux system membrane fusion protein/cobalt-zinc-cadmium efflux system membrane fusion protein
MVYLGAGAGVLALVAVGIVLLSNGPGSGPDQDEMRGMSGLEGTDTVGSETPAMDMGGTTGNGTIRLRAADVGTFGITFGTVDVRPLDKTIRAVGLVEFDETRMAYVAPKFGGWVERLHVDFTGQPVRRGQALLDVYSPELVTAQEELLLAARMAETVGDSQVEDVAAGSRDLLESARRRLRYWDISDAQIERLLETGEVRKTLTLYAPVS